MILQKSPNLWSCLPTAFAIAIGYPVEALIEVIGHDGSHIQWPQLEDPECRSGFHTQEIIERIRCRFSVTPVEMYPRLAPNLSVTPRVIDQSVYFNHVIQTTRGVITGRLNHGHAVAYDHGVICDPVGTTYRYPSKDFSANCAWIITPSRLTQCNHTTMP